MNKKKKIQIKVNYFPKNMNIFHFSKKMNFNNIKNDISSLIKTNYLFIEETKKKLRKLLNCKIELSIKDITIDFEIFTLSSLNEEKIQETIDLGKKIGKILLIFPIKINNLILNSLFKLTEIPKKEKKSTKLKKKTKTEIYIQKKFFKILTNSYLKILELNKKNSLTLDKNLTYRTDKKQEKELQIQLNFELVINLKKIKLLIIFENFTVKQLNQNLIHKKKNKTKKIRNNLNIESIYDIKVNLIAKSQYSLIPLHKIKNLKVGEIISIRNPEKIVLYIEKIPIFKGTFGYVKGKKAIKLNNFYYP